MPEMVTTFNNHQLNVVRIFQREKDLLVEIFLSSHHLELKATIRDILQSIMPEDQPINFTLYDGIRPHSAVEILIYEGAHAHDDILDYYFALNPEMEKSRSVAIHSFFSIFSNLILLLVFLIPVGLFIWNFNLCGLVVSIGILAIPLRQIRKFAYSIKILPDVLQVLTILGWKSIYYPSISFLEVYQIRGYHLKVEYSEGEFFYPLDQMIQPTKDRDMIVIIIHRAKLALVSGLNRNDCVFRPMQPYLDD
jgi:hypothetical protein